MSRTRFLIAISVALSFGFAPVPIRASVVPIGAFSGTLTETWESFSTTLNSETTLPDPAVIMQGAAILTNPNMVVYQTDTGNSCSLGNSGYAQASDGVKGMCLQGFGNTGNITFNTPVVDYGAYWAAWTDPQFGGDPAMVSVSFFDSSNALIDSVSFSYSHAGLFDGGLEWHGWSSTVPIKRITYSEDYVTVDGLQANPVPEPTTLGLLCIGGMFLARRRR